MVVLVYRKSTTLIAEGPGAPSEAAACTVVAPPESAGAVEPPIPDDVSKCVSTGVDSLDSAAAVERHGISERDATEDVSQGSASDSVSESEASDGAEHLPPAPLSPDLSAARPPDFVPVGASSSFAAPAAAQEDDTDSDIEPTADRRLIANAEVGIVQQAACRETMITLKDAFENAMNLHGQGEMNRMKDKEKLAHLQARHRHDKERLAELLHELEHGDVASKLNRAKARIAELQAEVEESRQAEEDTKVQQWRERLKSSKGCLNMVMMLARDAHPLGALSRMSKNTKSAEKDEVEEVEEEEEYSDVEEVVEEPAAVDVSCGPGPQVPDEEKPSGQSVPEASSSGSGKATVCEESREQLSGNRHLVYCDEDVSTPAVVCMQTASTFEAPEAPEPPKPLKKSSRCEAAPKQEASRVETTPMQQVRSKQASPPEPSRPDVATPVQATKPAVARSVSEPVSLLTRTELVKQEKKKKVATKRIRSRRQTTNDAGRTVGDNLTLAWCMKLWAHRIKSANYSRSADKGVNTEAFSGGGDPTRIKELESHMKNLQKQLFDTQNDLQKTDDLRLQAEHERGQFADAIKKQNAESVHLKNELAKVTRQCMIQLSQKENEMQQLQLQLSCQQDAGKRAQFAFDAEKKALTKSMRDAAGDLQNALAQAKRLEILASAEAKRLGGSSMKEKLAQLIADLALTKNKLSSACREREQALEKNDSLQRRLSQTTRKAELEKQFLPLIHLAKGPLGQKHGSLDRTLNSKSEPKLPSLGQTNMLQ